MVWFAGGWHKFQFIPNARVPILKVESNLQNISCDISIDNLQGQMKSKFLFWINDIDERFRDMVFLVDSYCELEASCYYGEVSVLYDAFFLCR